MKAKKFEQQFDDGADITASLDMSKARRVLQDQKRVNVDFPTWMIDSLDREASKLGGDEAVRDQGLAGRAPSGDEFYSSDPVNFFHRHPVGRWQQSRHC
jgi:hypothetical protein